jgi:hypothetical protein
MYSFDIALQFFFSDWTQILSFFLALTASFIFLVEPTTCPSTNFFYNNYLNNSNFNNNSDKIKILRIQMTARHCQW